MPAIGLTTLSAVKEFLDISGTGDDALLTNFIKRASALIEKYCRRTFGVATYHQRLDGPGDTYLLLPQYPIVSVTEIKVGSIAIAAESSDGDGGYFVSDANAGIIFYPGGFPKGTGNVQVTYQAGYDLPGDTATSAPDLPFDIEQACIELVAHWFEHRDAAGIRSEDEGSVKFVHFEGDIPDPIKSKLRRYRQP
jgi:uncharacterized phiE125 gp8 family phage protein